jgi:hypothetical protein
MKLVELAIKIEMGQNRMVDNKAQYLRLRNGPISLFFFNCLASLFLFPQNQQQLEAMSSSAALTGRGS